ncbi:four helix bundle protein [Sulfuriroseicoccus oceanibius]|uniref:Four helix bundle protein n=1 Tax=Sulfuriroseicoccus oceanibius TaxID=2707525 RepID=A0A6B3L1U0_9BACT|nr:four helix bundle protein [Sulfuriroseicoccus oceanibius]QQL44301.1 four helix bundle protein [Sulfuriroseicoccus oceanibius]
MSARLSDDFLARTKWFAKREMRYYVALSKGREEVRVCSKQLLRAGTSVAAHVREANRARSNAEFVAKLGGALQEADESLLWLELLREECGGDVAAARDLEGEGDELIAIMSTMIKNTQV